MADQWTLRSRVFSNCNCSYGCPWIYTIAGGGMDMSAGSNPAIEAVLTMWPNPCWSITG